MDFLLALKLFRDWAVKFIPKAISKNKEIREEVRSIIGDLADDINSGLSIIIMRLRASKRITDDYEFSDYISDSEHQIYTSFSEFKVCAGIRNLEDRFNSIFDPTRTAVDISSIEEVKNLVSTLENHERLIYDMLSSNMKEIQESVRNQDNRVDTHLLIDRAVQECEKKQEKVKEMTRNIIDIL